jgi:hypothetical protein
MSSIDARNKYDVRAVTRESCAGGGTHIATVKLGTGMQTAAFVIGMIEHGASYDFGGDPLVIDTCPFCASRVVAVNLWR